MKLVRLNLENSEVFSHLDPFEILSTLNNPNAFAIGGITGNEEEYPAALLVGMVTRNYLIINWLAVDPDHQGQGLGEELLLRAFDIADKGRIPKLLAVMGTGMMLEEFSKSAGDFFTERMFETEQPAMGWSFSGLDTIGKSKLFSDDEKKLPKPVPMSGFNSGKVNNIIEKLMSNPDTEEISVPAGMKGLLDMDLSFVFMEDDDPCGALFVLHVDDFLMPVLYYAESEREGEALVRCSYKAALSKYGRDQEIFILTVGGASDEVHRKVLEHSGTGRCLEADMEAYRFMLEFENGR